MHSILVEQAPQMLLLCLVLAVCELRLMCLCDKRGFVKMSKLQAASDAWIHAVFMVQITSEMCGKWK